MHNNLDKLTVFIRQLIPMRYFEQPSLQHRNSTATPHSELTVEAAHVQIFSSGTSSYMYFTGSAAHTQKDRFDTHNTHLHIR
jgi:hypothetical protein